MPRRKTLIKDCPFTEFENEIARPVLFIRALNPRSQMSVIVPALIDTGADESAFPIEAALALGYKIKPNICKKISTAGGDASAYPYKAKVEILAMDSSGQPVDKTVHTIFPATIDFIEGLEDFLIGRSCLVDFILEIDYTKEIFSVLKPEK